MCVLRDKRQAEKHTHIKVTGIQLPESFPPASPDLHYQKSGNRSRARTRTLVLWQCAGILTTKPKYPSQGFLYLFYNVLTKWVVTKIKNIIKPGINGIFFCVSYIVINFLKQLLLVHLLPNQCIYFRINLEIPSIIRSKVLSCFFDFSVHLLTSMQQKRGLSSNVIFAFQ